MTDPTPLRSASAAATERDLNTNLAGVLDKFLDSQAPHQVKLVRQALNLTQNQFAQRFRIPLGTLRDWEQGRKVPDTAARAYLVVILRDPALVIAALAAAGSNLDNASEMVHTVQRS